LDVQADKMMAQKNAAYSGALIGLISMEAII
jgi:hypothetical protein